MIFIDRTTVPKPACLDLSNPSSKASKELSRAKIHYLTKSTNFEFKVYSEKEVRDALDLLFKKKCAYCQGDISGHAQYDIEHFRPKGTVYITQNSTVGSYSPGYYWLAADWENLFLSCPYCNRLKKHDGKVDSSGKYCYFGLSDNSKRHRTENDGNFVEEEKVRLLLNPCVDQPKKHLVFNLNGTILGKTRRGNESIEVYGLQKKDLIEKREKEMKRLEERISEIYAIIEEFLNSNQLTNDMILICIKRIEKIIQEEKTKIINNDVPYSAFLRNKLAEQIKILRKLKINWNL